MPSRQRPFDIGTPTAQPNSLLYTLPPELRLMVFELVVHNSEDEPYMADTTYVKKKNQSWITPWSRRLAFLLSCRLIYHEACDLFYAHGEIGFDNDLPKSGEVRLFIHDHSSRRLAGIPKVLIFAFDAKDITMTMKLLVQLPRLRSLRFIVLGEGHRGMGTWKERSLRGDRQRSAVLWNRRLRAEQKDMERALGRLKSLTKLELVVEEAWAEEQ